MPRLDWGDALDPLTDPEEEKNKPLLDWGDALTPKRPDDGRLTLEEFKARARSPEPEESGSVVGSFAERWGLGAPAEALSLGLKAANLRPTALLSGPTPGSVQAAQWLDRYAEKTRNDLIDSSVDAGLPPVVGAGLNAVAEMAGPEILVPGAKVAKAAKAGGDTLLSSLVQGARATAREAIPLLSKSSTQKSAVLRQADEVFANPPTPTRGLDPGEPPSASWLGKWFTVKGEFGAAGELGDVFKAAQQSKDAGIRAQVLEATEVIRDFNRAIKAEVKKGGSEESLLKGVNDWLETPTGAPPPAQLSHEVIQLATRMRSKIDDLTEEMLATPGAVPQSLEETLKGNVGQYLRRSYRAFYDPEWTRYIETTPEGQELWGAARDKVASMPEAKNWTDAEVEGYLRKLLDRDPDGFHATGEVGLGHKDLGLFKARKDVPKEIRSVLGEETDPRVRFRESVGRMSHHLATHQMQDELLKQGDQTLFFARPTGRFTAEVEMAGKRVHTSPELAAAVQGTTFWQAKHGELMHRVVDGYIRMNSGVKAGLTAFNPQTHGRNILSWSAMSLAGGHSPVPFIHARKALQAAAGNLDLKGLGNVLGLHGDDLTRFRTRATELGVIGESATGRETLRYLEEASGKALSSPTDAGRRAIGKFTETVGEIYAKEDDVGKLIFWQTEIKNLGKAFPELAESQPEVLEQMAARATRDLTPTYSMAPRYVEFLRKFPVAGTFPTFWEEVGRNTKNIVKYGISELGHENPAIRAMGAKRLGGLMTVMAAPTAAAIGARELLRMDRTYMDSLRGFVAPWERDAELIPLSRMNEDGEITYFQTSFMDPWSAIKEPVIAALTAGRVDDAEWDEAMTRSVKRAAEPFLGEEPLFSTATDVLRNQKPTGRPVYNEEDPSLWRKAGEAGSYAFRRVGPGGVKWADRVRRGLTGDMDEYGNTPKTWQEMVALAGPRIRTINIYQGLIFRGKTFEQRRRNVLDLYKKPASALNSKPGEVEEGRALAENVWQEVWQDGLRMVKQSRSMGAEEDRIRKSLRQSGLSKRTVNLLLRGAEAPRLVTLRTERSAQQGREDREVYAN